VVAAGRVGRAHGLDGSFYVTGGRPRLLVLGTQVTVVGPGANGLSAKVVRRAGTDEHPIVRLEGIEDRNAAEALRGVELTVALAAAPSLGEEEWWASELEGCEVFDGERPIGIVTKLVELPSCEALEVSPAVEDFADRGWSAGPLLVPMVRDAIRHVDPAHGRIDVDMSFLEDVL
jgi:16S rRNA processing protein RimM